MTATITDTADTEAWKLHAACRDHHNPDMWFPESADIEYSAQALRICRGCPVRDACADYATRNAIRYGIWGGQTERRRHHGITR